MSSVRKSNSKPRREISDAEMTQYLKDARPVIASAVFAAIRQAVRSGLSGPRLHDVRRQARLAAQFGAFDAATRFDPRRDTQFATFASRRVKGAWTDWAREASHLGRYLGKRVAIVRRVQRELSASLGRAPSPQELAKRLGWDDATLEEALNVVGGFTELNETHEVVAARSADPHAVTEAALLSQHVKNAIAQLRDERERRILQMHFFEELTHREIAKALALSPSRITQLKTQALDNLRQALAVHAP